MNRTSHSGPLSRLLQLLYPQKCCLCQRLVDQTLLLCPDCKTQLQELRQGRPFYTRTGLLCVAPFLYEEPLRSAFLRYKFQGLRGYSAVFGPELAQAVVFQLNENFDLVTWAPVSEKRKRRRGYDQAELLAGAVAQALGLPLVSTLNKRRHTRAQSTLGAEQRETNVKDAYLPLNPAGLKGKRILLVDDIVTTGSTLSACAAELQGAGAAVVVCAVLARNKESKEKS